MHAARSCVAGMGITWGKLLASRLGCAKTSSPAGGSSALPPPPGERSLTTGERWLWGEAAAPRPSSLYSTSHAGCCAWDKGSQLGAVKGHGAALERR